MKIREIKSKSVITKSNLNCDYVINPYVGCMHGCIYCYARFMKRFTNHPEAWGCFVDVKVNAPNLISSTNKYKNKEIFMSSVTDPYQPIDQKYALTREILKKLIPLQPKLAILTKSSLITRDIDLLRKFRNLVVGISVATLKDDIGKQLEPLASPIHRRIRAIKTLKEAGLKTYVFISPILPGVTNWKAIIQRTKNYVDEFWFENLNLYPTVQLNILKFLRKFNSQLIDEYQNIYSKGSNYWRVEEKAITNFCREQGLISKIYFHHRTVWANSV